MTSDTADNPAPTPSIPQGMKVSARFSPQAWANDYAIEVDAEGPDEWDATAAFNAMPADYRDELLAEMLGSPDDEVLDHHDVLFGDPASPDWVQRHRGPFSLYLRLVPA